jgi:hypothetical protein
MAHTIAPWLSRVFFVVIGLTVACGKQQATPTLPTPTSTPTATPSAGQSGAPSELTFVPDSGIRIENASNPAVGIDGSGTVYLYHQEASSGRQLLAMSSDGLTFGGSVTSVTNSFRPNDSRRTQLPDGSWRLYAYDLQARQMKSHRSFDGAGFTPESGARYAPAAGDGGTIGVYDAFTSSGQVVLLYLGDLQGKNNLRRAVSTDNGDTFTFDREDLLGDGGAGGGSRTYVDPKQLLLPDGRRRLFVMKGGNQIFSFIGPNDGSSFSLESGERLDVATFSTVPIQSLNDPVAVRLPDGRYRIYVAARLVAGGWGIVSATTPGGTTTSSLRPLAPRGKR